MDTSTFNVHQLRSLIGERVAERRGSSLSLLFVSFGYKHGIPADADFVFDIRCLPNPHWDPQLRLFKGTDAPVIGFLEQQPGVARMYEDIRSFLERWVPAFEAEDRNYMCVAVGCTGGQHRSVTWRKNSPLIFAKRAATSWFVMGAAVSVGLAWSRMTISAIRCSRRRRRCWVPVRCRRCRCK